MAPSDVASLKKNVAMYVAQILKTGSDYLEQTRPYVSSLQSIPTITDVEIPCPSSTSELHIPASMPGDRI